MPPIAVDNSANNGQRLEQRLEKSCGCREGSYSLIKVKLFKSDIFGIPKKPKGEFCSQIEFLLTDFVGRSGARVMAYTDAPINAVPNAFYQFASSRMLDRRRRLFC